MANRAIIKYTDESGTKEYGTNLGEQGDALRRLKGHRLFREAADLVNRATFRVYGPKTFFCITDSDYKDHSFKLKGFIMKPVHGKDGIFERLGDKPVTLEFDFAGEEAAA